MKATVPQAPGVGWGAPDRPPNQGSLKSSREHLAGDLGIETRQSKGRTEILFLMKGN